MRTFRIASDVTEHGIVSGTTFNIGSSPQRPSSTRVQYEVPTPVNIRQARSKPGRHAAGWLFFVIAILIACLLRVLLGSEDKKVAAPIPTKPPVSTASLAKVTKRVSNAPRIAPSASSMPAAQPSASTVEDQVLLQRSWPESTRGPAPSPETPQEIKEIPNKETPNAHAALNLLRQMTSKL